MANNTVINSAKVKTMRNSN